MMVYEALDRFCLIDGQESISAQYIDNILLDKRAIDVPPTPKTKKEKEKKGHTS